MPLKLIPPRAGRSKNYTIRGTYLRVYLDESAGTHVEKVAAAILRDRKRAIERGDYARRRGAPTFTSAAVAYADAGGEDRFLGPLIEHFKATPLPDIDQDAIDHAANTLYPNSGPATKNRCVYTPVNAILRRNGIRIVLHRPKGGEGRRRTDFLWPDQAFAVFEACPDREWRAFLVLLCYTGLRFSEAAKLRCDDIRLAGPGGAKAIVPMTKNGDPRGVHLPPAVVAELANLPAGLDRGDGLVFFLERDRSTLQKDLRAIFKAAGVPLAPRLAFHIFRHTYGTWQRMYGGLTREGLVETGAWRTAASAGRYDHAETSEAARRADLLPVPGVKKA